MLQNTNSIYCGLTETTEHILLHCPFATQVWSLIPLASNFDPGLCASISEVVQISGTWFCLPPNGISSDIFSWVCWNLWTTQNQLLFEVRPVSAQATTTKSLVNAREWLQAQDPPKSPSKNTQIPTRPPIDSCRYSNMQHRRRMEKRIPHRRFCLDHQLTFINSPIGWLSIPNLGFVCAYG